MELSIVIAILTLLTGVATYSLKAYISYADEAACTVAKSGINNKVRAYVTLTGDTEWDTAELIKYGVISEAPVCPIDGTKLIIVTPDTNDHTVTPYFACRSHTHYDDKGKRKNAVSTHTLEDEKNNLKTP